MRESTSQAGVLALQFDDAREREKLAKRVSHRTWQKACRTQYLQGKWNVGRMGAQVFCQGDAGKVSFELSSLLCRLRRLENGIECVNAVEFCLRVC